ncbi:MAG TPA: hypothetical protein VGL62_11635, partial [Vicinamibacterales bacterium]
NRLRQRGLVALVAGGVVGAIGVVLNPAQFAPSWLIGFMFCTGLTLGSLSLLMTQHMSGGAWGLVTRRIFEAGTRLLPYAILLFIPIMFVLPQLYVWARPDAVRADEVLQQKAGYLNVTFFLIRAAVYFIAWGFCTWYLNVWSAAQDRGEVGVTEADTRRFRVVSAPGLLVYVFLLGLASTDWLMSLDTHWYATMFGFILVAGQALCALSFAVAVLAMLSEREPMSSVARTGHFHDLGKLMLAFVMLWTYFSFSQFLIIWAGNLPEEVTYYLVRLRHGWQYVSLLIIVGHFAFPFALLLSATLKRRPRQLMRVAWYIVAIRLVDMIWIVAPNFNQGGFPISLANVGIPVALAGLWVYLFAGQLQRHALVPINDPYFRQMLARETGGH